MIDSQYKKLINYGFTDNQITEIKNKKVEWADSCFNEIEKYLDLEKKPIDLQSEELTNTILKAYRDKGLPNLIKASFLINKGISDQILKKWASVYNGYSFLESFVEYFEELEKILTIDQIVSWVSKNIAPTGYERITTLMNYLPKIQEKNYSLTDAIEILTTRNGIKNFYRSFTTGMIEIGGYSHDLVEYLLAMYSDINDKKTIILDKPLQFSQRSSILKFADIDHPKQVDGGRWSYSMSLKDKNNLKSFFLNHDILLPGENTSGKFIEPNLQSQNVEQINNNFFNLEHQTAVNQEQLVGMVNNAPFYQTRSIFQERQLFEEPELKRQKQREEDFNHSSNEVLSHPLYSGSSPLFFQTSNRRVQGIGTSHPVNVFVPKTQLCDVMFSCNYQEYTPST